MSKGFLSIWNPENHFTFYDILLSNLPYFSTAFPSLSKKPPAVSAVASRRRPPRSRRPRASGDVVAQSSGAAREKRSGPPLKPPGEVPRGKWSAGETWVAKVESFQSLMRPTSKQHSASSNFPSNALGCFGPRVCTVNTIPGDNGQVRKVLILVFIHLKRRVKLIFLSFIQISLRSCQNTIFLASRDLLNNSTTNKYATSCCMAKACRASHSAASLGLFSSAWELGMLGPLAGEVLHVFFQKADLWRAKTYRKSRF